MDFSSIKFLPKRPLLRELTAERLNTILQEIKRNKPKGERGITVRESGGCTYIGLATSLPKGGSTANSSHPFKISSGVDPESEPENPTYLVTVQPGTVNNLLPSGVFENEELKQYPLAEDTLKFVVLTLTTDGTQIVSAEIDLADEASTAQQPTVFGLPASAEFLIGAVWNSAVYQVINTNLNLVGQQFLITEKESPAAPGELPYNIYYIWGEP